MNTEKLEALLRLKSIKRLPNTPHHMEYNVMEHSYVVAVLFKWLAAEEDVSYNMDVFERVLLHDFVESVTGDLNYCVKNLSEKTYTAWGVIEEEVTAQNSFLSRYTDEEIKETLTPLQYDLFKCCDYLDLFIFSCKEIILGNRSDGILACYQNCMELICHYSKNRFSKVRWIVNYFSNKVRNILGNV